MIAPKGEFAHVGSGLIQVIDDTAVTAMANAFTPGDELLVDWDHWSHDDDKPTAAAGWIQNLISRPDGLWGQIRWSGPGAIAVKSGEYRYISPVWLASDCESLGNDRVRPLRLYDAALTNKPNLKGIAALSNRQQNLIEEESETTSTLAAKQDAADKFSEEPVHKFSQLVRSLQNKEKLRFEDAWNRAERQFSRAFQNAIIASARDADPSLTWVRFANAAREKLASERAKSAPADAPLAKFSQLVRRYQNTKGLRFEEAWDQCSREAPILFHNAVRASGMRNADQSPTWVKLLESKASRNFPLEPGPFDLNEPTMTTGACPFTRWDSTVNGYAAHYEVPYEEAWEMCKHAKPGLFAQYVSSFQSQVEPKINPALRSSFQ